MYPKYFFERFWESEQKNQLFVGAAFDNSIDKRFSLIDSVAKEIGFDKAFREACESCFKEVAVKYSVEIFVIGFDSDHAHAILDLGKYNEPDIRKWLKGTSGKKLLERFPEVKKKYFWGSGLWGRQYYCYSIGSDMNVLNNYVKKQKFFSSMQDKDQKMLSEY